MLKVALHCLSGSVVPQNSQSVYSLHREKKKKDKEFKENPLQPTISFGCATEQPASSYQPWFRIFSLHFGKESML